MASQLKKNLVNKIYNYCRQELGAGTKYEIASQVQTLGLGRAKLNPSLRLLNDKNERIKCDIPITTFTSDIVDQATENEVKEHKKSKKTRMVYILESNPKNDMKDILESDPTALSVNLPGRKILVDYSSPNIAKQFHVGHLRSTIIGNAICNVKEKLGEKVVRVNYLGDWGPQVGLLERGIELAGYSENDIKNNPMQLLYQAFLRADEEAINNPEFREKALKLFLQLEEGDAKGLEMWEKFKGWTEDYLKNMYGRLGVSFDEYQWESSYRTGKIKNILDLIKSKNLLATDDKQRICAKVDDKLVPLFKSDGTSLYLVRDLGAIYDRSAKHNFDEAYYVVDSTQSNHFKDLFSICEKLDFDKSKNVLHVKLSTIKGLSTRKGQVVFLEDVFNEAKSLMLERQTTIDEKVADIAGISAVVVGDLRHIRTKPYDFDWEKILDAEGDNGVQLQYTHCKLHNLLERFQGKVAKECDPEALTEEQAIKLGSLIVKYEEAILEADTQLEPHAIAKYLLKLSNAINDANESLNVENADDHVAGQRLLLFQSSKKVLEDGLKLIGLKPLEKM